MAGVDWADIYDTMKDSIASSRSFYGVIRVETAQYGGVDAYKLTHGMTKHGVQLLGDEHRGKATTYYALHSGVGKRRDAGLRPWALVGVTRAPEPCSGLWGA